MTQLVIDGTERSGVIFINTFVSAFSSIAK